MQKIQTIVKEQKAFFNTGQTKDAGFRKAQLDTRQKAVGENRTKILDAPLRYPPYGNKLRILEKIMR